MGGVYPEHPGESGQRTGHIQLVSGPGNVTVAEIFQIVVNPGRHGHPGAASGHDLTVFGGPKLTHIQELIRQASVDRHYKLGGSVPQKPFQQPGRGSSLCLVASSRSDVVQTRKRTVNCYKQADENQNNGAAPPKRHFKSYVQTMGPGLKTSEILYLLITEKLCLTDSLVTNQREKCCLL